MWPCHTTQEAAYEAENWGFLTSTEGCRDGLPAEAAVSNLVAEQQLAGDSGESPPRQSTAHPRGRTVPYGATSHERPHSHKVKPASQLGF